VKCLAFFGGVFGFFMFWQSDNPASAPPRWSVTDLKGQTQFNSMEASVRIRL